MLKKKSQVDIYRKCVTTVPDVLKFGFELYGPGRNLGTNNPVIEEVRVRTLWFRMRFGYELYGPGCSLRATCTVPDMVGLGTNFSRFYN